MLVQLIADIHGDIAALEAALARGKELGAERLVCLGDVVESIHRGRSNAECVERLAAAKPWIWIIGNHDRWLAAASRKIGIVDADEYGPAPLPIGLAAMLANLPAIHADANATWVHTHALDPEGIQGITPPLPDALPTGGVGAAQALEDAGTRLLFTAHTHVPFIVVFPKTRSRDQARFKPQACCTVGDGPVALRGRRAVINPGSIADPRRLGSAHSFVLLGTGGKPSRRVEAEPGKGLRTFAMWDTDKDSVEIVVVG